MEKGKRNLIVFIVLLGFLTAALSAAFWPLIRELGNPAYRERFGAWVEALGWKGVLLLLGLQVLQVVVAVIPGEPVELLAGAAYGALGGAALCLGGATAAGAVIFALVGRFGAPLVEKFFRTAETGRFAFLRSTRKTSLVVFILFLIPGTPKDTLTYLVPLSGMRRNRFLILSSLARLPSVLSSTLLGDQAMRGNWVLSLLIFLGAGALGLGGILFSGRIVDKLKGNGSS